MSTFRRKPREVEAVRFDGDAHTANAFLGDRYGTDWEYTAKDRSSIWVLTAVGLVVCEVGDWLVKTGEKKWVVEADAFEALYEPVDVEAEAKAKETRRAIRERFYEKAGIGRDKLPGGASQ